MPFILHYVGSLRIVLTIDDPKALVDCPLWFGGSMWWDSVLLYIPCLRDSDTECQLWYFPLPGI